MIGLIKYLTGLSPENMSFCAFLCAVMYLCIMALGSVSNSCHLVSKCSSIRGQHCYSAVTASQNHSDKNVPCSLGLAYDGQTAAAAAAAAHGERGLELAEQGFKYPPPPHHHPQPCAVPPSLPAGTQ